MNIISGFADISLAQLLLVACVALFAAVVGGLAGYGTGALMPLVLVPLIGAEPVVPIIAISSIFTNLSRFAAYIRYADRRRALIVISAAALTTGLGAYGYTRLTNAGAALVIAAMLISSVPLRRLLRRRDIKIGDTGLAAGAVGYGVVVGGTSGSGVILLSLLMAAGLEGAAVIATDAVISAAALTTVLGAYGYTRLTNAGAALVIGVMLISSVPLRRLLKRHDVKIGDTGLAAGAVGYGVVVGGTSGSGVILLSLLMAAGLEGAAVIATDAVISVVTSVIKISVFGLAGVVTAQVLAFALLIGAIAIPGAFLAKAFVERLPVHIHTAILDLAVIAGGLVMISAAVRQLV